MVVVIMNKASYISFPAMAIATSLLLVGCQSLTGYKKIDNVETAENVRSWSGQIIPIDGEVNISCAGTYHCEIVQIDKTLVISTKTHQPVDSKIVVPMANANGISYAELNDSEQAQMQMAMTPLANNKSVKIVPLAASGMQDLTNYYARLKPAKREIQVNFYPENNLGYTERFAMIHEFLEPGNYVLQAYRNKVMQDDGSLLDNASPAPLCIDLLKDSRVQRRFCKQLNTETQGEFVETNMTNEEQ